ncbi:ATP-binding protein [Desulfatitalea tepidiphila]|uniref:ATP-binding protein n=1 Tax=Desulfatitalea tepidiphila TaxID=1185843 RepID=UPI0006B3FAFA|nr:ATP-binding protein [Desulfatitalea tepidiphila]
MWRTLNLKTRIYLLLSGLMLIALSSGSVMVWYTYRIQGLFNGIVDRSMAAFESAAALELALVNQKGFVTYYFLDGDPGWLQSFTQQHRVFQEQLGQAQQQANTPEQQAKIQEIADRYIDYVRLKERVIEHYKRGEREQGTQLHQTVRQLFEEIIAKCEAHKLEHLTHIRQVRSDLTKGGNKLRFITIITIAIQMVLAIVLGMLLVHQIFSPVYAMLKSTTKGAPSSRPVNVVAALGRSIDSLLVDVNQAHQELEKSRENLLQAEKMAMVGRLAAGMAHSIRNPFTSVKMRLFSLGRSLELDATQKEDFEVISQEIRHIDTIVQNFLEFSRPPKLVMQPISPSVIVDHVLQLLSHRLDSYGVKVDVVRSEMLPEVMADPEQLKEVLVNLIVNACEEMKSGGTIVIDECVELDNDQKMVVLYISDNGPGVSPANVEKIFQPFFTTKDEGTGLGLSIAKRIVAEHGGTLALDPSDTAGATFIIHLPLKGV